MKEWFKKNGATVLSIFGIGDVILTTGLAIKATPEALTKIDEATKKKGAKLTKKEKIMVAARCYIPTAIALGTTIASILGANVLNKKQQAALSTALVAAKQSYEKYKAQVNEALGPKADDFIEKYFEAKKKDEEDGNPPWDAKQTFYLEGYPEFFEATMQEVIQAEYMLNRLYALRGCANFNDFLRYLKLPTVDDDGEELGWDAYEGAMECGYQWIDFTHRYRTINDDMLVCDICTPFPAHRTFRGSDFGSSETYDGIVLEQPEEISEEVFNV